RYGEPEDGDLRGPAEAAHQQPVSEAVHPARDEGRPGRHAPHPPVVRPRGGRPDGPGRRGQAREKVARELARYGGVLGSSRKCDAALKDAREGKSKGKKGKKAANGEGDAPKGPATVLEALADDGRPNGETAQLIFASWSEVRTVAKALFELRAEISKRS